MVDNTENFIYSFGMACISYTWHAHVLLCVNCLPVNGFTYFTHLVRYMGNFVASNVMV